MATKAEIEAVWGNRKPVAIIDLDNEIAGVKQVIVMRPNGGDFIASIDTDDDYMRVQNLFPRILAPSKGDKLTGANLPAKTSLKCLMTMSLKSTRCSKSC